MTYAAFLDAKRLSDEASGFEATSLPADLYDFQRAITAWAIQRGRAAIFADCGLGKTPMQLAWAQAVHQHTESEVLIFAPLAVSAQTVREGEKFGIAVNHCHDDSDVQPGLNITNYERLERFDRQRFAGIVLDESSILKGYDTQTRLRLGEFAATIPYRLACTATPAPNDLTELVNHAEFLGVMSEKEIKALFFTQDGNTTTRWRLKGHAQRDFWRWMASWSVAIRAPSDLGFSDDGFELPPLRMHPHVVSADDFEGSTLFAVEAQTLLERRQARRDSLGERARICADLVNASTDSWIVWCDLNAESDALTRAIPGAVEVKGSDSADHKERSLLGFADGSIRVLVTKPSIAGHGMNLQVCHRQCFVGLSDSYEQFYQAVRRCWRFGQSHPVDVHVVTAETEGAVVRNIERKERQAAVMMSEIVGHMKELSLGQSHRQEAPHERNEADGHGWRMLLGDSVEAIHDVDSDSAGLIVYSPPFPGMYAYTNTPRDMGNVSSIDEMIRQYTYLLPELLRVLRPGRSCCVHLCQTVAQKGRDGYIGLKDFRGEVIKAHEDAGFVYYGEVCIDKDPQVKAIRTKDRGLLFKTLATDSAHMHMALADYLLQFRKPGENDEPIRAGTSERYQNEGWITSEEWIEWAAPVWYRAGEGYPGGIRETDVLNVSMARESNDERHLCPLQLGVIERAVKLWSNPGDVVLSPFAGVGSEGVGALRLGRRFMGIELKRSYYEWACRNLTAAEGQLDIFHAVTPLASVVRSEADA